MAKLKGTRKQRGPRGKNQWKPVVQSAPPNSPSANQNHEPPEDMPPQPNFPPTPEPHHPRAERTRCKPDQTPPWKIILEFGTFFAGLVVAYVYLQQLAAMRESNRINRESLESVQRAFINFKSIEMVRGKDGDRVFWSTHASIENSGNTPAVHALSYTAIVSIRDNHVPQNIFETPTSKIVAEYVAPKEVKASPNGILDEKDIFGLFLGDQFENISKTKPSFETFICGWTVYRDVFPGTPLHLTEFCRHLGQATVINEVPKKLKFDWMYCPQHNCTDEDCPDYAEMISVSKSSESR